MCVISHLSLSGVAALDRHDIKNKSWLQVALLSASALYGKITNSPDKPTFQTPEAAQLRLEQLYKQLYKKGVRSAPTV